MDIYRVSSIEAGTVKALAIAVALSLNAVIENMGGSIFVKIFEIFRIEEPGLYVAVRGKLGGDVGGNAADQFLQTGRLRRTAAQSKAGQAAAVCKQIAADGLTARPQFQTPQTAAVIKCGAVQYPYAVGKGNFLQKIAADAVQGIGGHSVRKR